jgi:hypothetical protein
VSHDDVRLYRLLADVRPAALPRASLSSSFGPRLKSGTGRDSFTGILRNDRIFARDGIAERIDDGSGYDRVRADRIDGRANCEARI